MFLALRIACLAGLLVAGSARGQTAGGVQSLGNGTVGTTGSMTVPALSAAPRGNQPLLPGANSFTEGQARSHMEDKGFGSVRGLRKDDQGVWHAMATKDGKSVALAMDYQGNVVTR